MDRAMIAEHLSQAERHVLDGERHVARQRELVAELERDGHDTQQARDFLLQFEDLQRLHVADRGRPVARRTGKALMGCPDALKSHHAASAAISRRSDESGEPLPAMGPTEAQEFRIELASDSCRTPEPGTATKLSR